MVYFFLFTVVALSWSTYSPSWHVSVALTVLLGLVGYLMFHRRTTLEAHFPLASVPLTSGAFLNAPSRTQPGGRGSRAASQPPSRGEGSSGSPNQYRQPPAEPAATGGYSRLP